MTKVKEIYMQETNGCGYPVFVCEDGKTYEPHSVPTGYCWALHWGLKEDTTEHPHLLEQAKEKN
jgi:hypothetical protein